MPASTRLLQLFRERHPTGTVVADLVRFDAGVYTVRAEVRIDRQWVLGSGLAVHTDLERAEERAIERALQVAGFGLAAEAIPREAPAAVFTPPTFEPPPPAGSLPLFEEEPLPAAVNGNGHAPYELEPPVDLSDLLAQSDVQMQRIGWGSKEGRDYLQRTFGKSSRQQLDVAELQAFLRHLKAQPNHLARRNTQAPF
ncbi:regulatory protein GemA [Gloeobacter morelensis]|uniref:DRBM domain-containing protein n=1 Tax=Gloeobacter morelensis MG652769 TaxID=2781736 RepID=A0ABY3PPE7_9CYAN|nr:regulatory protein GemA [Gloeobacter morelensis]UFP95505.1 hypothetical protein ISF26_04450 [Gloeobacter morelensis MG652769]